MEPYRVRQHAAETALEPELPIVDSHHHLWEVVPGDWLPYYSAQTYEEDLRSSGHNIVATVYTDSLANYRTDGPKHLRVVGETEYCEKVAQEAVRRGPDAIKLCSAIASTANMFLGDAVGEILDAHMAASPRFRGIRQLLVTPPTVELDFGDHGPDAMASPEFRAAFRQLGLRNLSFEAVFEPGQIGHLLALARDFPEVPIILNHLGHVSFIGDPEPQQSEAADEWRGWLRQFAEFDQVSVKVGGLNQNFKGLSPSVASLRDSAELENLQGPYILQAIDIFGPQRCMFESNFPVDGVFTSMTTVWNVFKRVTRGFSASERADLFANTARRVYRF